MTASIPRNIASAILSKAMIARIHEASLHLLAHVGMKIAGTRSLDLLLSSGAELGANGLIRFPRSLVEQALFTAPKEIRLYTRDGEPNMLVNTDNQVYFGTHADQLKFVDPWTGNVRDFLRSDTHLMCKIADALPNIAFVLSVGMASDIRPEVQTQVSFLETLQHFSKTINFSTNDVDSLQEVIDMAALVAGGHGQLAEKPFVFNYCEPLPPLTHPFESTEKLYISAKNRIPVVYMPYCMMGGTAPMSFAAALTQCNAEVLAGLVITQLAQEGAPLIYGAMPSIIDMRTTVGSYGAVEFHLLVAAASEMAAFYELPFYGTAGCTDALSLDEQAVAEATMEIFSTLLSKANIVHDVGVGDHCNNVCPELVVLTDEIITMLGQYFRGVCFDTDSLAEELELIENVGPSGHFLHEVHTMEHFRDIHYSALFTRKANNQGPSEVRSRIRNSIESIWHTHQVPPLEQKMIQELQAMAVANGYN